MSKPSDTLVKLFAAPGTSLGSLDAEAAATVIAAASDVALVLDREGVIRDVAFGSDELSREDYGKWLGKRWSDTVTVESRPKIEALLKDAAAKATPRWRQVNHPSARGADVPIVYSAVQIGAEGRVVAMGRDLRSIAALQQRLVEAQQSMERDYWRLRHVETRYRLLFQMATEAVLIVDAASHKVVEANPAANALLGVTERRMVGRPFLDAFDGDSAKAIDALLTGVRVAGRADDVRARLASGDRQFLVSASLFRHENASLFLVRLSPLPGAGAAEASAPSRAALLGQAADAAPDAVVVTEADGRVLAVNAAFVEIAQLASEEQARGESLERWLGRPGVDLNVMITNLRQHGAVRLFATTLRGEQGTTAEVEISAAAVKDSDPPCFGFMIRDVGRRLPGDANAGRAMPRSVEQLTELVGRVPLKELVREATDLIERLAIEAALELTRDNRASAAEMLGSEPPEPVREASPLRPRRPRGQRRVGHAMPDGRTRLEPPAAVACASSRVRTGWPAPSGDRGAAEAGHVVSADVGVRLRRRRVRRSVRRALVPDRRRRPARGSARLRDEPGRQRLVRPRRRRDQRTAASDSVGPHAGPLGPLRRGRLDAAFACGGDAAGAVGIRRGGGGAGCSPGRTARRRCG